jgi:hypothetical protein
MFKSTPDVYGTMLTLWKQILPECEDTVNTWYKFSVKKLCCTDPTFYPIRLLGCSDLQDDFDSLFLRNAAPDSMYYAREWKEGVPTSFPSYTTDRFPYACMDLGHIPIQCTLPLGNGRITLVSWNLSGMCNTQKRTSKVFTTTSGDVTKTTTVSEGEPRNPIKDQVLSFIQDQLKNKVDVLCLQELFLPDKSTHTDGKMLLEEFCGKYLPEYDVYYDGFICGMIVHKRLVDKQSTQAKQGGRGTRKRKGGAVPFPSGQDYKQTVLKLHQGETMYLVNVCLTPLHHLKKQHVHENDMRSVMEYLQSLRAFSNGVLFVGDHKHNGIDFYGTIRQETSR